jgi:microsomal epoxide hydrolase
MVSIFHGTVGVIIAIIFCVLPALIDHWALPQPPRTPAQVRASQKQWGNHNNDSRSSDRRGVSNYVLNYDDAVLADLKTRLQNWRPWHQSTPMNHSRNWSYGIGAEYMNDLVPYWADTYDWRAREKKLNDDGLKSTVIDGLNLVFQEYDGDKNTKRAILLLHGWPGSLIEFHKMIPILRQSSAQGFAIVCPSLPGYGFSSPPTHEGFNSVEMANTLHRLMAKLGYDEFIVHGGDWVSEL